MKLRVGLVTAVALVLLASPLAVKAQQTGKVWRIGILGSENTRPWESFRQALRELGYVEGRNLVLEQRWSEGITPLASRVSKTCDDCRTSIDALFDE